MFRRVARVRPTRRGGVASLVLLVGALLSAAACGSTPDDSTRVTGSTAGGPGTETASGSTEPKSTTPRGDDAGEEALFPADVGFPDIGTILDVSIGDSGCWAAVLSASGERLSLPATDSICPRADELIGRSARLVYTVGSRPDCDGAENCGRTQEDFLVAEAVDLGDRWVVMANADWVITVGRRESWSGVNGTGALTYYGCEAMPRNVVAGLNDPSGGCLALGDGTMTCRDGTCTSAWRNGEHTYALSTPLSESGVGSPGRLRVTKGDTVLVDSPGLELGETSETALVRAATAVNVAVGGPAAVVSGAAVRGERVVYLVNTAAGHRLEVSVSSLEDNAVIELIAPSGDVLVSESTGHVVAVTEGGSYLIGVAGTRGNATFELTVTLS